MDPNNGVKAGMYPEVHGPPPAGQMHGQPMTNYGQPMQPMTGYSGQQSTTTVILQQPQAQQNPLKLVDIYGTREWSTGICDCFSDMGNCLFTWCCYPCAICQLASRTGECLCTPCCVPGTEIILRARIRTIGGIRGSVCNDCLTVACLGPCAACQEHRELRNMGL